MFWIFKNKQTEELKSISKEIQLLISNENYDSDSMGIKDGGNIIEEYLLSNEKGIAFEHLLYMISETGLELSEDLLQRIYSVGKKMGFTTDMINDEIQGVRKMNLQNKTKACQGTVTSYWFENENIRLSKTLFHRIEIPLVPFDSGLSYESQPVETVILIDWLNLKLADPSDLDGISITTEKGSNEEISIYLGSAHNPCDINMLELTKIAEQEYSILGELFIDFEHEGIAKNEIFRFETLIDFKEDVK